MSNYDEFKDINDTNNINSTNNTNISSDQFKLEQKIKNLNKEIFLLKRKIEHINESRDISQFKVNTITYAKIYSSLQLNDIFNKICDDYINGINSYQLAPVKGGESLKKFYILTVDDIKYLFVDFRFANEHIEDFIDVTNFIYTIFDSKCVPQIYFNREKLLISEYIGDNTMENIIGSSVCYKSIQGIYHSAIKWIVNFRKHNYKLNLKEQDIQNMGQLHLQKIKNILNMTNAILNNEYIIIKKMIDSLYESNSSVILSHNDFQVSNIMWSEKYNSIQIIDYQDCCYNLEHYDIVSLLYGPKNYLTDAQRSEYLNYYYELLGKPESEFTHFVSTIIKTAFIRVCKSLELRLNKLINNQAQDINLITEIRRSVSYLEHLEKYVGVNITSKIKTLLPENNLMTLTLCAGKGTRMKLDLPKCIVNLLNKPMLTYNSNISDSLCTLKNIYVVGYKKELVIETLKTYSNNANNVFVQQNVQLGTGHAVMQAIHEIENNKIMLVLMGDMPVLTQNIVYSVINTHIKERATSTIITKKNLQENHCGKIIRNSAGEFEKIVEHKDIQLLSEKEMIVAKNTTEVNTGIYVFNTTELKKYIIMLDNNNSQNEYYLTDIFRLQKMNGHKIVCYVVNNLIEPTGANTIEELNQIESIFSQDLSN